MLNDQFLSHERLEFMLQELMLSIVETYLARRQAGARLWRGSPFADNRIRKALALLRAHPNKEVNMNELASQVGLSRSRFYDLFQLCTGRSPRSYLDMLCVESAISKLSSGSGKIAEVSAELGFSAQSNFTRFFQQQVGIPPSEYRRAAVKPNHGPAGRNRRADRTDRFLARVLLVPEGELRLERRQQFDEMRAADGKVRPHFGPIAEWLAETPAKRVAEKRREADLLFHRVGITFAVYGDEARAPSG